MNSFIPHASRISIGTLCIVHNCGNVSNNGMSAVVDSVHFMDGEWWASVVHPDGMLYAIDMFDEMGEYIGEEKLQRIDFPAVCLMSIGDVEMEDCDEN